MVNLGAIARLVNVMREFSPDVAKQAIRELWELQQAVNRIDLATQRILEILETHKIPIVAPTSLPRPAAPPPSHLPADWQAPSNPDNAEAAE